MCLDTFLQPDTFPEYCFDFRMKLCVVYLLILSDDSKVYFVSRRALILLCRVCFNIHNLLEPSFLSLLVVHVMKTTVSEQCNFHTYWYNKYIYNVKTNNIF